MTAVLQAQHIDFSYAKTQTIHDVSLELKPGRFLGVLGVNGSGKSTLMNCMDELLHPQSGAVVLGEELLATMAPRQRAQHIAYVTQHSHANRNTVYDALLLGRKPYIKAAPTAQDYAIVDRVIEDFHLQDFALRYVDELSGGEYQKMIIARAFVQDTEIILLDEPTNNLDLANQLEVLHHVKRAVVDRQVAAAAVMHDINLALQFCDDLAFMKAGKLIDVVPAADVTAELVSAIYDVQAQIITHGDRRLVVVERAAENDTAEGNAMPPQTACEGNGDPVLRAPESIDAVAAFFDRMAPDWHEANSLSRRVAKRLDDILGDLAGKTVIDVACGTGVMFPYYLQRDVAHITAMDVSPKMVEGASEHYGDEESLTLLVQDFTTYEGPKVDAVVIYNAYPHFADKNAVVAAAARILNPGGRFLVAHGMGRGALNGHHKAIAAGVSTPLHPAVEEMAPWQSAFAIDTIVDSEDFFAISGTLKN